MKHVSTHKFVNFPQKQRGASLIESIAYLGIAAMVIIGAISLLSGAFSSSNSNRGISEVTSIRTGIKKLYLGTTTYKGLAMSDLNNAKIFPTSLSWDSENSNFKNSWGGTVTAAAVALTPNTFTIVYTNVPKDACIAMIAGASGWLSVKGAGEKGIETVPTLAEASTHCTTEANSITYTSA